MQQQQAAAAIHNKISITISTTIAIQPATGVAASAEATVVIVVIVPAVVAPIETPVVVAAAEDVTPAPAAPATAVLLTAAFWPAITACLPKCATFLIFLICLRFLSLLKSFNLPLDPTFGVILGVAPVGAGLVGVGAGLVGVGVVGVAPAGDGPVGVPPVGVASSFKCPSRRFVTGEEIVSNLSFTLFNLL